MRRLMLALVVIALTSACTMKTGGAGELSTDSASVGGFARLLQTGVSYDYEPFASPIEQRDASDLVVVGRVADVVLGRTLPYGRPKPNANLVVTVEETIRGSSPGSQTVYVEVRLPSGMPIADLRAAAPDARVLLFLVDTTHVVAVGGETGRPAGARIFTPFVQGVIIEAADGWVSGLVELSEMGPRWRERSSFDGFVKALRG
jgi:hypothetical protein